MWKRPYEAARKRVQLFFGTGVHQKVYAALLTAYGVLAAIQWGVDQVDAPRWQRIVRLNGFVPRLSVWQWLVIGVVILSVMAFESYYRQTERVQEAAPDTQDSDLRARVAALRAELFPVGEVSAGRKSDGAEMFLRCAMDLSAAGLCPESLGWPWYGDVDWNVVLRFLGRLKVLGFVESKTHTHTFNQGMNLPPIHETSKPVETFYLTIDGAAALRIIEKEKSEEAGVFFA
jgi:hypothetical protein